MLTKFSSGIKQLFYNCKRVISWIPTIWEDRSWDYTFMYKILRKKLEEDANFYDSNAVNSDTSWIVKQQRFAIKLLDRIIADDYMEDYEYFKTLSWDQKTKYFDGEEYRKDRDIRILGQLLEKHSRIWWE